MKIIYDHQIFSHQKHGGVSRYFYELANTLAQYPLNEIAIISPLYINEYLINASPSLQVKGLKVPKVTKAGPVFLTAVNRLLSPKILRNFKPDVIHQTYYDSVWFAPRSGKTIVTVYDMIHERFPEFSPFYDRTRALKATAVARADHVICISENTRRDLIDILGVNPKKTSVVYLGFSLTQSAVDLSTIKTHRPYLLYVGKRRRYKNFETLLHAYASSQELMSTYDLLTFGGEIWGGTETARARALGIDSSRLHNIQGDDSILASLYRNASLFIYPSLYEGFGLPPLEAMSFGCPVICSETSSLPEVVGDAANLFDPRSSSALLNNIEQLLNDSGRRKLLIERGYARSNKFSWRHCAEQTFEIYKSLI